MNMNAKHAKKGATASQKKDGGESPTDRITRKVALFVAFCSVFYFFIKLLFL
jgi:hypothetical protein